MFDFAVYSGLLLAYFGQSWCLNGRLWFGLLLALFCFGFGAGSVEFLLPAIFLANLDKEQVL